MGGFFSRRSTDGRERWWLQVTGKGEKTRLVPATGELMSELIRYRTTCELSPSLIKSLNCCKLKG